MKRRMRNLISITLLVAFFLAYLSLAADYKYVGSAKSNKYHYPTCEWALKIKAENLVTFNSAREALEAGYVPCKVCNPPTED